jgi:integrase
MGFNLLPCNKCATLSRMKEQPSRKQKQADSWPRTVQPGRAIVRVYRRKTPSGNFSFLVANYADDNKRRLDAYPKEVEALEAANKLAQRLDARDYVAASMTKPQAIEYANSEARLKPLGVTVDSATAAVVECMMILGSFDSVELMKAAAAQGKPLPSMTEIQAAATFYREHHKQVTARRVALAVDELVKNREGQGASPRYISGLKSRLTRFAADFQRDVGNVTTADIQTWLDGKHFKSHNLKSFVTMIHTLFDYCQSRGYCEHNPAQGLERVKTKGGSVEIYTADEINRLLLAASPDFRPCLVLGAFAGLRSAEIERLTWKDIDLEQRQIVIGADQSKTATRRIVPLADNAVQWLALTPKEKRAGSIWKGSHDQFHDAQQATATATATGGASAVKWKSNGLRHSFVSCVFALTNDAGRTAGFAGNSPAVVHKFYRELVKPADARAWFNVRPQTVVPEITMPGQLPFGGEVARQDLIPA